MPALNPYLNFNGNAEEAMEFYRSVFGGEFEGGVMRWKDAPGCGDATEFTLSDEDGRKVMHMQLPLAGGAVIMASDAIEGMGPPMSVGNNVTISISPESREEADRLFDGLSAGGDVQMPMADAFWGGYFGAFTDKFGIPWLINYDAK